MNSLFTILVVLVLATAAQAVKPKDCGSKATSLKIKVSGCEDADAVCPFITGQNVTLTAEFTPGKKRGCYSRGKEANRRSFVQRLTFSQRRFNWRE